MPLGSIPKYKNKAKQNKQSWAWWRTLVIPVLWEAETVGSGFAANLSSLSLSLSLSLLSEALRNFVRPSFKIKYKKIGPGV